MKCPRLEGSADEEVGIICKNGIHFFVHLFCRACN